MLRKSIITVILGMALSAACFAQNGTFQLFYISKDYTTSTTPLLEMLGKYYEQGRRDHSVHNVFYLSNADNPIIVRQNLPDDNSAEFDSIREALITKSETRVYPQVDLPGLLDVFAENDIVRKTGDALYEDCELFFLITPSFWDLHYNEQIIARLFYALGLGDDWARNYVGINIYHCEGDGLEPDTDRPFGPLYNCEGYDFQLLSY